jgi:hypothetical protein
VLQRLAAVPQAQFLRLVTYLAEGAAQKDGHFFNRHLWR